MGCPITDRRHRQRSHTGVGEEVSRGEGRSRNGEVAAVSRASFRLAAPVSPYLKLCVSLAAADLWAALFIMTGSAPEKHPPDVISSRKHVCAASGK